MMRFFYTKSEPQVQKMQYHKHIEQHKYARKMVKSMFRGAPSMGIFPWQAQDVITYYVEQDINHKLAADTLQKLQEGKHIDPDEDLIAFIHEVNQKESFTSPELYRKFNEWCKKSKTH